MLRVLCDHCSSLFAESNIVPYKKALTTPWRVRLPTTTKLNTITITNTTTNIISITMAQMGLP